MQKYSPEWQAIRFFAAAFSFRDPEKHESIMRRISMDDKDLSVLIQAMPIAEDLINQYWAIDQRMKEEELALQGYKKAKTGFVYLIHLFDDVYKIGQSANPDIRRESIKASTSSYVNYAKSKGKTIDFADVTLIHTIKTPDMTECERFFLALFRSNWLDTTKIDIQPHSEGHLAKKEVFRLADDHVKQFTSYEYWEPSWWQLAVSLINKADLTD